MKIRMINRFTLEVVAIITVSGYKDIVLHPNYFIEEVY